MQICMKLTIDARDKLAEQIKSKKAAMSFSMAEIARATGVDPGQTSRICSGDFRTLSHNVMQICTFLGIDARPVTLADAREQPLPDKLVGAVAALWDGSPRGAETLINLLQQLAKFQKGRAQNSAQTRARVSGRPPMSSGAK
jgi:transcriptional regulator with XRE-family HTH domain